MSTELADKALLKLKDPSLLRNGCFINGAWQQAGTTETMAVHNPATGAFIGTVPNAGSEETRDAIAAAEAAGPDWRRRTAKERSTILRRWFDLILDNQEDLAVLMTSEQG